jgi:VanZ family protein
LKNSAAASGRRRWRAVLLWLAVIAWMGLVTWLSSKPGSYFPKVDMPEADKIVHIVLFATGAFFASGAMLVSISLPRKVTFGLTVAVISVFGMLDEYHQLFTPGRSGGDVGDWAVDTFGAFCGVLLIDWIVRTSDRSFRGH